MNDRKWERRLLLGLPEPIPYPHAMPRPKRTPWALGHITNYLLRNEKLYSSQNKVISLGKSILAQALFHLKERERGGAGFRND